MEEKKFEGEIIDAEVVEVVEKPTKEEEEFKNAKEELTNTVNEFNELTKDLNLTGNEDEDKVNLINEVIDKMEYNEDETISKDELKEFMQDGNYDTLVEKMHNRVLMKLMNMEPNLLSLLYVTENDNKGDASIYSNTGDFVKDGVEYYLKEQFCQKELEFEDFEENNDGDIIITKKAFYVPDLFKIFDTIDKSNLFKDKSSVSRAYSEAIMYMTDHLRQTFFRNNIEHARASVNKTILNLDIFVENVKFAKKNKIDQTAIGYHKERLAKKIHKLHKDFDLESVIETVVDVFDKILANKTDKMYALYGFIKLLIFVIDKDTMVYLISFLYSLDKFLRLSYLMAAKAERELNEEETKTYNELEEDLKLDTIDDFFMSIQTFFKNETL